jgi:hypothetical protein
MAPTGHSALGSMNPTLTHGLPLLVHRSAQECRQQATENPILCISKISRCRAFSTVTFAPCHHFPSASEIITGRVVVSAWRFHVIFRISLRGSEPFSALAKLPSSDTSDYLPRLGIAAR